MKHLLLHLNWADKLKYLASLMLVFISVAAFSQNTYYIDPGAASNGDGSMNSPFDGWDKVFPMEVGATYLQKTGTIWNDSLGIEAEGVTIGAYGPGNDTAKFIVAGKNAISNVMDTANNVTIKDLWITTVDSGMGIAWIHSASLTVENVEVDSTDGYGIFIDSVDNFVVKNSHIHHNERPFLVYNSDNWLVEGNSIHDGITRGGFQTNNTNGGMFRYNYVFNDPNKNYLLFVEGNDTYMYNVLYFSEKAGAFVLPGSSSTFIGNTFDDTKYAFRNRSANTIIKNNIFSNMSERALRWDGARAAESDYNLFYNYNKGAYLDENLQTWSLAEWQAMEGQTLDLNSIEGDANFVDEASNNYALTDSSAAIDAATTLDAAYKMALAEGTMWPGNIKLQDQFEIGSWDIGAFAYAPQSVFYIDPAAAENGDGKEATPYNSWQNFTLQEGMTYLQKRGTVSNDTIGIGVDNVTIGSYGPANDTAKIMVSEKDAISNVSDTAKNVTLKDLWITTEGSGKGIYWQNTTGLTVENVEIDSTDGFGIHIDGVNNFVVRSSHIHHNDRPFMVYNSDNWLVEKCEIHDGISRGGFQTNNTNGGMFRYNKVYNDLNKKYLLFTEGNDTYAYNIFYNATKAAAQVTNGNSTFIGNVFDNTSWGLRIKSGTSTIVKNNIFSNLANRAIYEDGALPSESDYNMFYNVKGAYFSVADGNVTYSIDEWQAINGQTLDLNSFAGDPNYVDATANNYALTDSSEAIDAGIALADEYKWALDAASMWPDDVQTSDQADNGKGWEIGAYVFPEPITYVDPSLSVDGDGSLGNPYNSWASIVWEGGRTYLQKRGTVSNDTIGIGNDNVTIGSYGPEGDTAKIIVAGKNAISNVLDTAKNVTIRDLYITTVDSGMGIAWMNSANLTVENVEVDSTDGYGIFIDGVDNFVVKNSHIHHNERPFLVYNSNNWLVEGNSIHDGITRGGFQTNNTNGGMFRYNYVFNDPNKNYLLFVEGDDTYMYNVLYNSEKAGAFVLPGTSSKFIGNTFDNTKYSIRNRSTGSVIKNNIFANMSERAIRWDGAQPAESDYNLFYNYNKGAYLDENLQTWDLDEWQAMEGQTLDLNSIEGDANFVDEANNNYELTDSSAAIDVGLEMAAMYKMALDTGTMWPGMVNLADQTENGNGWEIGAYVYPTLNTVATLDITSENGTVSPPERTYIIGTVVELTAEGALGYEFESWSGDVTNTDNPLTVKLDSNINLTANYTQVATYTVTASTQNASVNVADSTVNTGSEIELSVETDSAYAFVNWTDASGDTLSSDPAFTLTVDKDYQLTANTIRQYQLTSVFPKGGTVEPIEGIFNAGTEVEVTAAPSFGYTFGGWSGDASGMDEVTTVTMDGNKEVVAHFLEAYRLTINSKNGSVDQESGWYIKDTTLTLTATPDDGYQFLNWVGGPINSTENPLDLTLNTNMMTISANFVKVYDLNISAENGSVNYPDTIIREGERIELTATPDEGYVFTGWTGDVTDDNESVMVTVESDMNITASFARVYSLSVTADNGSVNVMDSTAVEGTQIELTASADEGYEFTGWTGDVTGSDATITVTLDSDVSITANFEEAVGISTIGLAGNVKVYPNPAAEFLSIDIRGDVQNFDAELVNMNGQKVISRNISNQDELNISELKTGVYILRILDDNTLIYRTSIVKE